MFPHWGMESRQVMSPNHDLLPAHCTTASTRVLSKELSVKSFSSPSAPEEGPCTSSQGSPLRTVQLESENSFTHLPSPQGVCDSVFLLTSNDSSHSTQRSKQIGGICTMHLPEQLIDTQHNTFTIFTTQFLPLHCAVLRQELAAAQFALTNCEFLATSPLPLQSILLHHLFVHHFALKSSLCATHLRTVMLQ